MRNGDLVDTVLLEAGLRHGRQLLPAAASLLERHHLTAESLWAVAVSIGPGSYTGLRVGVMAAKALAYGAGCRLAAVSSLAALAAGVALAGRAGTGSEVLVVQDARRDEVYAGLYRVGDGGDSLSLLPDAAVTPEEAVQILRERLAQGADPVRAGSGFTTYADLFAGVGDGPVYPALVDPAAVGLLAWRQLLREESADPLQLQPRYLRRDAGTDWRHDALIATGPG